MGILKKLFLSIVVSLSFFGSALAGSNDGKSILDRAQMYMDLAYDARSKEEMNNAFTQCQACLRSAEKHISKGTELYIRMLKMSARVLVYKGSISVHTHLNNILDSYAEVYGSGSREYGRALIWCASLCIEAGDQKQAKEILSHADKFFETRFKEGFNGKDTLSQIMSLAAQVRLYAHDAEHVAYSKQKSLTRLQGLYFGGFSDEYLNSMLDLAEHHALRGHPKASFESLRKAREIMAYKLDVEFGQATESVRSRYWDKNSSFFYKLSDLAYDKPHIKSIKGVAYNSLLLSKGILLNTMIDYNRFVYSTGDSIAIVYLNEKRDKIFNNQSISDVEAADQVLVDYMNSQGYTYRNPDFDISWNEVADALSPDDIAIEYFQTSKGNYGVMFVRKGWNSPKCIKLDGLFRHEGNIISLAQSLPYVPSLEDTGFEERLAEIIWPDELTRHFPKSHTGKVYFSTVAELDVTPIEYLAQMHTRYDMNRLSSTRMLVKNELREHQEFARAGLYGGINYSVSRARYSTAVDSIRDGMEEAPEGPYQFRDMDFENFILDEGPKKRAALDYLPGAAEEIVSIHDILNDSSVSTDIFTGCYAGEEAFYSTAGNEDIIHMATHGFHYSVLDALKASYLSGIHDYTDPLVRNGLKMAGCSAIASTGGDLSDGYMTAKEISQMDLSSTRLVVLSACNSGQGDIGEDGIYGLQRAFKMAGAKTILMSLWEVDDEATKIMMQNFYTHLYQPGVSTSQAFNLALKDMKNLYPDPDYWAPFILLDALD